MENRVGDFVAGVETTFGKLAQSPEELAAFLRAAEAFYLDYIGAQSHSQTNRSAQELPFWRYVLFYSTLALDHAATSTMAPAEEEDKMNVHKDLASEISSCWPFLAALITAQYRAEPSHDPPSTRPKLSRALPSSGSPKHAEHSAVEASTQTEESPSGSSAISNNSLLGTSSDNPTLTSEDAVHSLPSQSQSRYLPHYAAATGNLHSSSMAETLSMDSFSTRSGGRSLSSNTQLTDTSDSTMASTDVLTTPPQTSDGSRLPSVFPYGQNPVHDKDDQETYLQKEVFLHSPTRIPYNSGTPIYAPRPHAASQPERTPLSGPSTPTDTRRLSGSRSTSHQGHCRATKTLLADRGDNTAKIVPTEDGSYILDVSIGGRKLVIHPDKPGEIQYHDRQGTVLTQHLVPETVRVL